MLMPHHPRYRCRFCGALLPAWLPAFKQPDGAMLLYHLGHQHRDRLKGLLDRMRTVDDIAPVAAEAFEVVEVEKA
jgi:hypothetical protein